MIIICSKPLWLAGVLTQAAGTECGTQYLTAAFSPITDCADVDSPGAISGWGQQVSAAALEVEVLPVKSAVVDSTPGHAGGWALRNPGTTEQTNTHHRGALGVWREEDYVE